MQSFLDNLQERSQEGIKKTTVAQVTVIDY
jgi:hypothetical protein